MSKIDYFWLTLLSAVSQFEIEAIPTYQELKLLQLLKESLWNQTEQRQLRSCSIVIWRICMRNCWVFGQLRLSSFEAPSASPASWPAIFRTETILAQEKCQILMAVKKLWSPKTQSTVHNSSNGITKQNKDFAKKIRQIERRATAALGLLLLLLLLFFAP